MTLVGFMPLLGFKINFGLFLSKTQEQEVAMHIIIKHFYSFISVTATQTEYNSAQYQIKWYQLTAQRKFFILSEYFGKQCSENCQVTSLKTCSWVLFLQLLLAWLKVKSLP